MLPSVTSPTNTASSRATSDRDAWIRKSLPSKINKNEDKQQLLQSIVTSELEYLKGGQNSVIKIAPQLTNKTYIDKLLKTIDENRAIKSHKMSYMRPMEANEEEPQVRNSTGFRNAATTGVLPRALN